MKGSETDMSNPSQASPEYRDPGQHGAAPVIWNTDELQREMLASLASGGHPTGRFLNGRIVAVLATPTEGTAKDVAVGFSAVPPGASTEEHRHPAEEIASILSGRGVVVIDGVPFDIGPGSVIFTPSNAAHRTTVTGDEPLLSWWMYAPAGSESRWLPSQNISEPTGAER